jgi:outer membrane protein OmpA-like peptidoglycan-associated protein
MVLALLLGATRLRLCGQTALPTYLPTQTQTTQARAIQIGVYGGYGVNIHSADFPAQDKVTGESCCALFKNGVGWGFAGGAMLDVPIDLLPIIPAFRERFVLSLRAGVAEQSGVLRAARDSTFAVTIQANPPQTRQVQASIASQMQATLLAGTGEALLSYSLTPALDVLAGTRVGVFYRRTYSQQADIEDATGLARFSNGERSQTLASNLIIPNVNTLNITSALMLGTRYHLPLTQSGWLAVAPEIFVAIPLSDIVPTRSWRTTSVRAGIAMTFTPSLLPAPDTARLPPPPVPSVPLSVLPPPQRPPFAVSIQARPLSVMTQGLFGGLSSDTTNTTNTSESQTSSTFTIHTEEFISRSTIPLLPYLFFEQKSSELPERYKRLNTAETQAFSERSLAGSETLEVYYHVLNILGERLRRVTTATVTITGCLGEVGFGPNSEENEPTLAQNRAESVAAYLRGVWGIAPERVKTVARGLPQMASASSDPLIKALEVDLEENRRVEITSDSWEILRPVLVEDTLHIASSGSIELIPSVLRNNLSDNQSSRKPVLSEWRIAVEQSGRVLREFKGTDSTLQSSYIWQLAESDAPRTQDSVRYSFVAKDSSGRTAADAHLIGVERRSIEQKRKEHLQDKEYQQFQLIGFDFESSQATEIHNRTIAENIGPAIAENSTVSVTGYSDIIGNAAQNQKLSEARAYEVALQMGMSPAMILRTARGLGGAHELFPNDSPEGRFYSRAVIVRIETPVR